jgi:uncharacterized Rmd1/YagE family protein
MSTVRSSQPSIPTIDAVGEAMAALNRSTNHVPITRIEWLVIAFIASQTIGNAAMLITSLRGHP